MKKQLFSIALIICFTNNLTNMLYAQENEVYVYYIPHPVVTITDECGVVVARKDGESINPINRSIVISENDILLLKSADFICPYVDSLELTQCNIPQLESNYLTLPGDAILEIPFTDVTYVFERHQATDRYIFWIRKPSYVSEPKTIERN